MLPDYGVIFSGGKGTRMGSIGEYIPKPLFPLFDETLLRIQLEMIRDFISKKVYINTHHIYKKIEDEVSQWKIDNVETIREEVLLGNGGTVHSIANQLEKKYSGSLMTLNSDLLINLDNDLIVRMTQTLIKEGASCILGVRSVPKEDGYNMLVLDKDNYITGIEGDKTKQPEKYFTYLGFSIINLEKIRPQLGASAFFNSVAKLNDKNTLAFDLGDVEFLDFGTSQLYWDSVFKLSTGYSKSSILNFLKERNFLNESELNKGMINYRAPDMSHVFNFSKKNIEEAALENVIIISKKGKITSGNGIIFDDIKEPVSLI